MRERERERGERRANDMVEGNKSVQLFANFAKQKLARIN